MQLTYNDLGSGQLAKFSQYLADYLSEELDRAGFDHNIDRFTVEDAISAYIGGAADHN